MSNTNSLFGGSDMMGACYAPFHQVGKEKSTYTEANVDADIKIISASDMTFIRTYTVQGCQASLPKLCQKHGVGLALGVWIFQGHPNQTETEIDTALAQASAYPDQVKVIVIGNEVDLPINGYNIAEVQAAFAYAKKELAKKKYSNISTIPLTICMTGAGPASDTWKPLLTIMESYAFLTIYPWYGQKDNRQNQPSKPPMTPSDISANMTYSYENGMKQAIAAGLEVVIAEIGWPSAGTTDYDTTWESEVANFKATCAWINGTNSHSRAYITMWFEMFDEPWKTTEGLWGPHWGIYGSGVTPVSKNTKDNKITKCS